MRSQSCHSGTDNSVEFLGEQTLRHEESNQLTSAEAAVNLKIKTRTVLSRARSGKIQAYCLAGTKRRVWRSLQSDLDAILIHNTPVISSAQPSVPCSKGAQ